MAVDTRRVTRKRVPQGPRKRTVRYVEEVGGTRFCGSRNAVDAARSAAAVDWV